MVNCSYRITSVDIVRTIKDPEEPGTLEELNMLTEDMVTVKSKQ